MRTLQLSLLLAPFLCAVHARAEAQFVELTADLEMVSWDTSFNDPPSFESRLWKFRCIVGTNSWFLAASNQVTATETWYYSGSNLFNTLPSTFPNLPKPEQTNSAPITRTFDFNGDPGSATNGPFLNPHFHVAWLGFCSGPFLNRPHREIPMPSTFWKQSWLNFDHAAAPLGFPDKTMQFEDDLALPLNIEVATKAGQPLFQYYVRHGQGPHVLTTNLLGWEFPLEFRAVQYLPVRGAKDKWQATLIAHGTLTSIKAGARPKLTSLAPASKPKKNYSYTLDKVR